MAAANSRRVLVILAGLVLGLLIGMTATLEPSYADTTTLTVKVTSDTLNVRTGPSTSYAILGKLSKNAVVQVAGTVTTGSTVWYKITYNTKTGYISAAYTTKYKQTIAYSPVRTGQTTSALTVRSGPGSGYASYGTLASGKQVALQGYVYCYQNPTYKKWFRITYNSKTAYIYADYVKILPATTAYSPAKTGEATVQTAFLSGPGTGYATLATLPAGTDLVIDAVVTTYTPATATLWYKATYKEQTGYVAAATVKITGTVDALDFEKYLTDQGFPESYKPALRALHAAHPKWVFRALQTGVDWSAALAKEKTVGISLVASTVPDAWKSFEDGAYDFTANTWIKFDSSWYAADGLVVAYYLDPRNFMTEKGIYQFLDHRLDNTSQSLETVGAIAEGSFLDTDFYKTTIFQAGLDNGMNPNVIAAMIRQEQGSAGTSGSISGTYPGYIGIYNHFNIGAYATSTMSAVERGLWFASGSGVGSTTYGRPWNSILKAINGGAQYYATNYIAKNQYNLYLKKFNVMNGLDAVATHQYMTHVLAAASEASLLGEAYVNNTDSPLVFTIPVFQGMPAAACAAPPVTGNNDNVLSALYVTGTDGDVKYTLSRGDGTTGFTRYTTAYSITVPSTMKQLAVNAVQHNNLSYVSASYVALDPLSSTLPGTFKNAGTTILTTSVTTSGLSVYSGPGLANTILGTYASGVRATVYESVYADGLTWYKVSYNGKTGYINSAGTNKLTTWNYYALQRTGRATANVNVRKSASTSGTVLGTAATGTTLNLAGILTNPDGSKWFITSYNGAGVSGAGIVSLTEGTNTIKITVTSTSGQKRIYTVTVNRN